MSRYVRVLQNTAFWLSVFVVVVSPWIASSNENLGCFLLGLIALTALIIACFSVFCSGECDSEDLIFLCFFALCVLSFFFQIIPLKGTFSSLLPQFSVETWRNAKDLLISLDITDIIGEDSSVLYRFSCVSLSPSSTLQGLILFTNYAAVFVAIVLCARNWRQISIAATIVTLSACFILLIAILVRGTHIYGKFWSWAEMAGGDALGPFTNRNHFALYMNLSFVLAAAMTWIAAALLVAKYPEKNSDTVFCYAMDFASEVPLRLLVSSLLAAGVFFSLSRGGMISWIVVMLVISSLFVKRGGIRRIGRGKGILAAIMIIMTVLIILLGWQKIFVRLFLWIFGGGRTDDLGRLKVLPYVFNLLGHVWTTGCGYGAFRHVFPIFQGGDVQFGRWTHSHNEWLQIVVEGGIPAFLLLCIGIVVILKQARKTMLAKETRISFLGIAFLAVVLLVLFQGMFDYGLRKPPNAWFFVFLSAVGIAVRKFGREYQDSVHAVQNAVLTRIAATGIIILAIVIFCFEWRILNNTINVMHFKFYNKMVGQLLPKDTTREFYLKKMVHRTRTLNFSYCLPDEVRKISEIYASIAMNKNIDLKLRTDAARESLRFAYSSAKMTPSEYLAWLQLGRALAVMGEWEKAWQCLNMADKMSGMRIKNVLFK